MGGCVATTCETLHLVRQMKKQTIASLRVTARRLNVNIEEHGRRAMLLLDSGAPLSTISAIIAEMIEELDLALL